MDSPGAYRLNLQNCGQQVTSLAPLEGMPLKELDLELCRQVLDLSPLMGMPLTKLGLNGCARSARPVAPEGDAAHRAAP